jgi:hypothetical protein
MSSDDVNPYATSSNDGSGIGVFGLIGVVVSALGVTTAIAAFLRYFPPTETQSRYEDSVELSLDHAHITCKSYAADSGRATVELL